MKVDNMQKYIVLDYVILYYMSLCSDILMYLIQYVFIKAYYCLYFFY